MGCGGSKQTATADQTKNSPKRQQQQQQQQQQNANDRSTTKSSPASNSNNTKNTDSPRGKYLVTDSSAANGSKSVRSDSTFSEATDKGFKRRLREKLQEATAGSDLENLERAMDKFTRNHLEDCGDYTRALQRLHFLRLRRDLRDAVLRSHVGVLKKAIEEAENSQFSAQLHNQIDAAYRKLQHLQELNDYKHDILTMEQSTISEIHSYQRPPVCVRDVMVATYLLLGHPEPRLTDWSDIQTLLCRVGRDSLIHEIRDFDSAHVDDVTNQRVQDILRPHELHDIRQASNGAATFYVWTTQICGKVARDSEHSASHQDGDSAPSARDTGQQPDAPSNSSRKKQKG